MDAHEDGEPPQPPMEPFALMPNSVRGTMDRILQYHRDQQWREEAARLTMESLQRDYVPTVRVETSLQPWHKVVELEKIMGEIERLAFIAETKLPKILREGEEHYLTKWIVMVCTEIELARNVVDANRDRRNETQHWIDQVLPLVNKIAQRFLSYWIDINTNTGLSAHAKYSHVLTMLYAFQVGIELEGTYHNTEDVVRFVGYTLPPILPIYVDHPVASLPVSAVMHILVSAAVASHGMVMSDQNEVVLTSILRHVAHLQYGAWNSGLIDDDAHYTDPVGGNRRETNETFVREATAIVRDMMSMCSFRRSILRLSEAHEVAVEFAAQVNQDIYDKSASWLVSATWETIVAFTLYPGVMKDIFRFVEIPGAQERYQIGTAGLNTDPKIVMQEMHGEIASYLTSEDVMHAQNLVKADANRTYIREMKEYFFLVVVSFQLRRLFGFPMSSMVFHYIPSVPVSMAFVMTECSANPDLPALVHIGREYFVMTFEMREGRMCTEAVRAFSDIYSAMAQFLDVLEDIDGGVRVLTNSIYTTGEYRQVDMIKEEINNNPADDTDGRARFQPEDDNTYVSIYNQVEVGDLGGKGIVADLDRLIIETEKVPPKRKRIRGGRT